jgi:hypothetical protein
MSDQGRLEPLVMADGATLDVDRAVVARSRPWRGPALTLLACAILAACSRDADKAHAPPPTAPVEGPRTLKPGLWAFVIASHGESQESRQCIGEGFDPGAEAAAKSNPCGKPTMTRTAEGFALSQACARDKITYSLTGVVSGDFTSRVVTDLDLTLQAYGRRQKLHMRSEGTYLGPCPPEAAMTPAG